MFLLELVLSAFGGVSSAFGGVSSASVTRRSLRVHSQLLSETSFFFSSSSNLYFSSKPFPPCLCVLYFSPSLSHYFHCSLYIAVPTANYPPPPPVRNVCFLVPFILYTHTKPPGRVGSKYIIGCPVFWMCFSHGLTGAVLHLPLMDVSESKGGRQNKDTLRAKRHATIISSICSASAWRSS